jgi:hypothetical protein
MIVINVIMQFVVYFAPSSRSYLIGSLIGIIICLIGLILCTDMIFDIAKLMFDCTTFFFLLLGVVNLDK